MSDPITTGGHHPQDQKPAEPLTGYEPIATPVGRIVKWLVALAALIVVSLAISYAVLFEFTRWQEPVEPAAVTVRNRLDRPAPRLRYDSPTERIKLHVREDELLNNAGWVDREAGVARIPIERAMEIIAERGRRQERGSQGENGSARPTGAEEGTE